MKTTKRFIPAAARRAFSTAAASILFVAGVNVITTSASAQGVNDRYYRFEEGVAGNCASGAGSIVDSLLWFTGWNARRLSGLQH